MSSELIPASEPDYQRSGAADDSLPPSPSQRLKRFIGSLRKFWWIPLLTLITGAGVGVYFAARMVPVYESVATMQETMNEPVQDPSIYSDSLGDFADTGKLLQKEKLRERALELLKSMTNSGPIPLGPDGHPPMVLVQANIDPKSSIFDITAVGSNPEFTRNYLDALMQAFINYEQERRTTESATTLAHITDQIQVLAQELKVEQDALMTYERTNDMGVLQEEEAVAGSYLEKLQTQLSDLELEKNLLKKAEDEIKQAAGTTNATIPYAVIQGLEAISSSGSVSASGTTTQSPGNSTDLEMMKMERMELAKYLDPNSQKLAELDDQIKRAEDLEKASSHVSAQQTADQLMAYIKVNEIRIDYVNDSIKDWQAKVAEANTRQAGADQLKLNIQRTQSVLDRYTSMSENLGISRSLDQESLAVLEPASPPYRSNSAEKRALGMSCFAGLAAGLGIIFLLGMRDDRFTSITEVNSALGDAVVGLLPRVPQDDRGSPRLIEANDSRHIYAESYRSLRSALRFLETGENRPKVLLITSATPNEGKSTVSANLAHTLAMAGSRVLLVDGDLRRGHLHRLLRLENKVGFTDLLSGICTHEQVIQRNAFPNLTFIARGKTNHNPGDLLLSSQFDFYVGRWRQEFDYVLIDSCPVFAAADAGVLASRVDGTLFLVRSHHSSAKVTRDALEQLVQRRGKILGVVFNMADTSSRSHYQYKYAEYYGTDNTD